MAYPPSNLPKSCRLTLWLAESAYNVSVPTHDNPNNTRARTLREIYELPLYGGNAGLLDLMYNHINNASNWRDYMTDTVRSDILNAIVRFKEKDQDRSHRFTIRKMLRDGERRSNANPGAGTLSGFLRVMLNNGVYFPNNHTDEDKLGAIGDILDDPKPGKTPLWDMEGEIKDLGKYKFGDLTMKMLFETPLKKLDRELFRAVRKAKRMGIMWADLKYREIGNPKPVSGKRDDQIEMLFYGEENQNCCFQGTCWPSDDHDDYCGAIEGSNPPECSAMSDPCH
ncbi:MAG: hypothetical protein AMXMBFR84_11580 [Candidatus Hydrogenedentota bacterium]